MRIAGGTPKEPRDITFELQASGGKLVELDEGEFITGPITLQAETEIRGASEYRTNLRAQSGGFNTRAACTISNLRLWRADWPVGQPVFGVFGESRVLLEKMRIEGFTVGAYVWGSKRDRGTNANGWGMRDLMIKGSGHAGIIVRGADANGGKADRVSVYTSCEHAEFWDAWEGARLSEGEEPLLSWAAGVVDKSFFGCTWDALLISSSGDRDENVGEVGLKPYPPMLLVGNSQHSVVDGMYRERDQSESVFSPCSIVCGGLAGEWSGAGLRVDGPAINALVLRNAKDPTNVMEMRLGDRARTGHWMSLLSSAIDKSRGIDFGVDPKSKNYRAWIAGMGYVALIGQDSTVRLAHLIL